MMFQVRIHGRGGQGVVSAAEMLSIAAFDEGRYAQAFPSFGSERMGAPVAAFCRIDDREIRLREPVMQPDALIVQDPTLLLLDETTDNLDLESAESLEQALDAFEGTVLAVTHDRWFARNMDRFLVFTGEGGVIESDEPVWDVSRR